MTCAAAAVGSLNAYYDLFGSLLVCCGLLACLLVVYILFSLFFFAPHPSQKHTKNEREEKALFSMMVVVRGITLFCVLTVSFASLSPSSFSAVLISFVFSLSPLFTGAGELVWMLSF